MPRGESHATGVLLEVADALAVLAVDGEAGGVASALLRRLQGVAGDPILGRLRRIETVAGRRFAAHGVDHAIAVEDADHRVDLGSPVEQPCAVTLHEASRHHDSPEVSGLLAVEGLADHLERFETRGLEEPAGVDHDRVGSRVVGDEFKAVLAKQTEHALAVDEVLRAAEADEGDAADVGRSGGAHGAGW